jgi:CRP-like cAMP-binding protein
MKVKKAPPHLDCEHCHSKTRGIFCELEGMALIEVNAHKHTRTFKKGEHIFDQGASPEGIFCINSGKIKLSQSGSDGKETIIRIASAGDILGHRSLFSNENYSATACALEETTVCFIDKESIFRLLQEEPKISLALIQKLSSEMGASQNRQTSLSQRSVKERFAELLLTLNKTYGKDERGERLLDIRLTREEMASMIGSTNETTTRLMTEFKERGLIHTEGKALYIKNLNGLVTEANLEI